MRKLIIIACLLGGSVNAQIIDNRECAAFTDDPFFNEVFIRNNKIRSMRGEISTKRKLQPLQSRGLITYYEFSEDGKLSFQLSTLLRTQNDKDTTVVSYRYDSLGRIKVKRMNDSYGFYSYNYTYDSSGLVTSEKYCRDENIGPSKNEFKLGKQTIIVSETYENEWLKENELRKRYYNNYGKPYQDKIYRWNEKGYLIEEETILLLNRKRNRTRYVYDEKGLVIKRTQSSNVTGNSELVHEYTYDKVGNLLESNEYRNGKHISKKEVLYTDAMLIRAIIVLDVATEYMTLVKYEFSFFDERNTTQN